jgi:hypothetical protein
VLVGVLSACGGFASSTLSLLTAQFEPTTGRWLGIYARVLPCKELASGARALILIAQAVLRPEPRNLHLRGST